MRQYLGCHDKKFRFHVRLLRKGGNKTLIDSPDQMSDRMRIDLEGDNGQEAEAAIGIDKVFQE